MTPQQIVGVAARLFAIWLAILSFQAVGVGQALLSQGGQSTSVPYFIAALYLGVAVFLWFFPMFVAHKLVPRTKFENTLQLPAAQAVVVACVVLGLWVIVARALPSLAAYLSVGAFWVANGQPISTLDSVRQVEGLVGLVQFAAGVLLIAKAEALAGRLVPSASAARE